MRLVSIVDFFSVIIIIKYSLVVIIYSYFTLVSTSRSGCTHNEYTVLIVICNLKLYDVYNTLLIISYEW